MYVNSSQTGQFKVQYLLYQDEHTEDRSLSIVFAHDDQKHDKIYENKQIK